jgi:hypothetical protein
VHALQDPLFDLDHRPNPKTKLLPVNILVTSVVEALPRDTLQGGAISYQFSRKLIRDQPVAAQGRETTPIALDESGP